MLTNCIRRTLFRSALAALALASCSGIDSADTGSATVPLSADNRYIVSFNNTAAGKAAVQAAGGQLRRDLPSHSAAAYELPAQALNGLANNPNIEFIEPDARRVPLAETSPYGIAQTQADQLSDSGTGDITVCIIDSGYDLGHEDLPSTNVSATADSGSGNPFNDTCGHGTHVAGTIAATGGNDTGVVGVNPGGLLNMYIVKVFGNATDPCAWSYSSDLIAAADECADNGANIISMSLGCSGGPGGGPFACASKAERRAFDTHNANGILSIAAAGNDGNTDYSYPASYDSVVSVAAIDESKAIASFSQQNDAVELAAPGVGVESTVPMGTGSATTLSVGGTDYEAAAMDGSPQGNATGPLVDCGLGDAPCTGGSGAICLIQRGAVSFSDKVLNCEAGGGVAAVVYNNEPGLLLGTLGGVVTTIPSMGISDDDGAALLGSLGASASAGISPSNYEKYDGTSMATPHVSGVAALLWSHNPDWTNDEIREALTATAEDLGAPGRDNAFGYGLIQAADALAYLQDTGSCTPTESPETSCGDGIDNDCDGATDGADADCAPTCTPTESPETSCGDGIDNDCDGAVDGADADCAPTCTPTETSESSCGDGIDNDCDGAVDGADSDCDTGGTCELAQLGDACNVDADCCSNKCKGPRNNKTCK